MAYTPLEIDRNLYKELDVFDPNWSLDEYREKVLQSLMYCMSWPEYHGNPERATHRVQTEERYIQEAYAAGESPNSAAAEVGFSCG